MTTTAETETLISGLIAKSLAEGLYHPGNGADQAPMTLRLPMFRTVGMPPEVNRQVELTVQLIAESIVYAIGDKDKGNCDIIPRAAGQVEDKT